MTKPLNPEKSKKLRPLRVILAILIAILVVLILDRLPTSVKDRENNQQQTTEKRLAPEGSKYYYFNGFLDILESQTEAKLKKLGVPEEEYENIAEYFTKDELFELETKATLAANLESVYVEADEASLKSLKQIFALGDDFDFSDFRQTEIQPSEYKILSDLLADYHKTMNTTEDYDVQE